MFCCIASQQREAWIETGVDGGGMVGVCGIASQQREAWIETALTGNGEVVIMTHRLPATGGVD